MIDNLRDRIAAVIYAHDCWDYAGGLECRCGSQFSFDENDPNGDAIAPWSEHVTDAVIRELSLRQEWLTEESSRLGIVALTEPEHPIATRTCSPWIATQPD